MKSKNIKKEQDNAEVKTDINTKAVKSEKKVKDVNKTSKSNKKTVNKTKVVEIIETSKIALEDTKQLEKDNKTSFLRKWFLVIKRWFIK